MRFRDTCVIVLCLVMAGVFFVLSSGRLGPIQKARSEMNLVSNEPLENAPPSLAFATVAMGAFRGLVVDVLWIRADKLKEEGLFFDAKQLADWITVLQPRFAAVWDFHAWNMAYNISAAMPSFQWEERWKWVRSGYELLRDRGIVKNPRSILLYRSLAWIFLHKIGDISDDCHRHYKREIALSMRALLGYPETNEQFDRLVSAPKRLEEVLEEPGVADFVGKLMEADEVFRDRGRLVQNYLAFLETPKRFKPAAFDVIDRFRGSQARNRFELFARAYQLRNEWKFDIEFMRRLNKKYGPVSIEDPNIHKPLNWEHPATHAIYWAELGLKVAGRPDKYRIDEKNTDRIVFHALQELYRTGRQILYFTDNELPTVFQEPDLEMFDSCDRLWQEKIAKYEAFEKGNPKELHSGYRNFLINSVAYFYQAGHLARAGQIYQHLRSLYPEGTDVYNFNDPLVTFVRKRMADELRSVGIKDAIEQIIASLGQAYFYYAIRDDDISYAKEKWAREIYDMYQTEMGVDEPGRASLPKFDMLKYLSFISFMNDPFYPEQMRTRLMTRIKVEKPDLYEQLFQNEAEFRRTVEGAMQKQQQ